MKLLLGVTLIAACIALSANNAVGLFDGDLSLCSIIEKLPPIGNCIGCAPATATNCQLPADYKSCVPCAIPPLDKAAGAILEGMNSSGGQIVDLTGCSVATSKLVCYFATAIISCGLRPLCKQTCLDFRETCLIKVDTDKIEQEVKDACAQIPQVGCGIENIPSEFFLPGAEFCNDLPDENCDDAGTTEDLVAAKAAVAGPPVGLIVALAIMGILAVVAGAVLYRKMSPERSGSAAAAAVASDMSSGKYSQASGKTRSTGKRSSGGRSSGSRTSGGGRSSRSGRSGRSSKA